MKLPKNLNLLHPPRGQYQVDTIGFGIIRRNPGLLLGLGLGKTYCSINIAKWRIINSGVKKILVVCPSSILIKWRREIRKFSEYDGMILHSDSERRIGREERIDKIMTFKESKDYNFGIINWEGIDRYKEFLNKIKFDMIIADESGRFIRNVGTNRTNTIIELGDKALYRMILTGRLIPNNPLNIWPQMRFLDRGKLLGQNFWYWRNLFFEYEDYGMFKRWELKRSKIPALNKAIYRNCIRFRKIDVLDDLPERIDVLIEVEMPKTLKEDYNKLKSEVLSEIRAEEGTAQVSITNWLTKIVRLKQAASGFIKDEEGNIRILRDTPKIDSIIEEVEIIIDNMDSCIIWCEFLMTIQMLSDRLSKKNIEHIVMTGADSAVGKEKKWRGFQKSRKINVFIGQIISGGVGLELFKEHSGNQMQHTLMCENPYVPDDKDQVIGRSEGRIGQKDTARIVDFVLIGSLDRKILNIIHKKESVANSIMKNGITSFIG